MTDRDFRDAYRLHRDVLYRFAYRMTGSAAAAEDVVQDSFLALWKRPQAYAPSRGPLRAFLLGIARNVALKRLRQERPHQDLDEDSAVCAPVDVTAGERAEIVSRAVGNLPPLQREALILAEYEEMSLEEIGQATESEIACVKSRLHRARENLRRMLAPLLEEEWKAYGTER
ncbi:MAG: RNA polymerase sigma factor [Bryobacteraceae bacterium]